MNRICLLIKPPLCDSVTVDSQKPLKPRLKVSELSLSSYEDTALVRQRAEFCLFYFWFLLFAKDNLKEEKGCEFVKRDGGVGASVPPLDFFFYSYLNVTVSVLIYQVLVTAHSTILNSYAYHYSFGVFNELEMLMNSKALSRLVSVIPRDFYHFLRWSCFRFPQSH